MGIIFDIYKKNINYFLLPSLPAQRHCRTSKPPAPHAVGAATKTAAPKYLASIVHHIQKNRLKSQ